MDRNGVPDYKDWLHERPDPDDPPSPRELSDEVEYRPTVHRSPEEALAWVEKISGYFPTVRRD